VEAGKGVLTGGVISMVARGGDSEGPKEWLRRPEKWLGRRSLAARNSLRGQGTTGGGYHRGGGRVLTEEDDSRETPIARLR
jgi:hypothetical protein